MPHKITAILKGMEFTNKSGEVILITSGCRKITEGCISYMKVTDKAAKLHTVPSSFFMSLVNNGFFKYKEPSTTHERYQVVRKAYSTTTYYIRDNSKNEELIYGSMKECINICTILNKNCWNKCEELLPQKDCVVIGYRINPLTLKHTYFLGFIKKHGESLKFYDLSNINRNNITHWKYLNPPQ